MNAHAKQRVLGGKGGARGQLGAQSHYATSTTRTDTTATARTRHPPAARGGDVSMSQTLFMSTYQLDLLVLVSVAVAVAVVVVVVAAADFFPLRGRGVLEEAVVIDRLGI